MDPLQYRPPLQLEGEVLEWLDATYSEAESDLVESHEAKLTGKLIDYIEGRQWSARARYGRSRPLSNRWSASSLRWSGCSPIWNSTSSASFRTLSASIPNWKNFSIR